MQSDRLSFLFFAMIFHHFCGPHSHSSIKMLRQSELFCIEDVIFIRNAMVSHRRSLVRAEPWEKHQTRSRVER
ncbi:hypothetical protein JOB18_013334 [Solea senegalensis]|nr:hypothetical protein JOB18_013334 [Solea senegalensis]